VMASSVRLPRECGETIINVFDMIHRRADRRKWAGAGVTFRYTPARGLL
jgi:hypothetical protein